MAPKGGTRSKANFASPTLKIPEKISVCAPSSSIVTSEENYASPTFKTFSENNEEDVYLQYQNVLPAEIFQSSETRRKTYERTIKFQKGDMNHVQTIHLQKIGLGNINNLGGILKKNTSMCYFLIAK